MQAGHPYPQLRLLLVADAPAAPAVVATAPTLRHWPLCPQSLQSTRAPATAPVVSPSAWQADPWRVSALSGD